MFSAIAEGTYGFVVTGKDRLSPSVARLTLAPAEGRAMRYAEGQFLSVLLPGGQTRCYSMAGADAGDGRVELHVRVHPGGLFSDRTLSALEVGSPLRAAGPFGSCVWRPWDGPTVMLGTGTGIAPLKAIVERLALDGHPAPVHLYWGVRDETELYLADHFLRLQSRLRAFRFIPVLAEGDAGFSHRRGFVQDAVAEDFPSLAGAQLYACGMPAMVEDARALLIAGRGLPADRFHADPFDPPEARPAVGAGTVKVTVRRATGEETGIEAAAGTTLLAALKDAGLPMLSVCGGKKACGTCRVRLAPDPAFPLAPPDRDEARLLAALEEPTPFDRLACQVVLAPGLDGLSVTLD